MITSQRDKLPFVLFQVNEGLYALAAQYVREIVLLPPVVSVPQSSPEIRGVINLRGKIIQLIDLRVKLGFPALKAELDALAQLLNEREQDHRNWLAELEACVRERRPFGLARDPHQCKFGRWYDQFSTLNRLLRMTLPGMDAPHKAIHATADKVLHLVKIGDLEAAVALISDHRNRELAALVKLFAESRQILADGNREVAIVLARGNECVAFSADMVEAAETIPAENIEPLSVVLSNLNNQLLCRVGKRLKTNQTILIFDDEFFFSQAKVAEVG